jgi:hypothetical protein
MLGDILRTQGLRAEDLHEHQRALALAIYQRLRLNPERDHLMIARSRPRCLRKVGADLANLGDLTQGLAHARPGAAVTGTVVTEVVHWSSGLGRLACR